MHKIWSGDTQTPISTIADSLNEYTTDENVSSVVLILCAHVDRLQVQVKRLEAEGERLKGQGVPIDRRGE